MNYEPQPVAFEVVMEGYNYIKEETLVIQRVRVATEEEAKELVQYVEMYTHHQAYYTPQYR